jgi:hypothetical protein
MSHCTCSNARRARIIPHFLLGPGAVTFRMNENRASLAYRGDGVINTRVFRPDEGLPEEATVDALGRATHGLPGDISGSTAGKTTARFDSEAQGPARYRSGQRVLITDGFTEPPWQGTQDEINSATTQTAFHQNEAGAEIERAGPDTNAASGGTGNYP